MLDLTSIGQLAAILESSPRRLYQIADDVDRYVRAYELTDRSHPQKKSRIVLSPSGPLRCFQSRLLQRIFRLRLRPTRHSYGGVPGRNAVQNAAKHLESRFVFTTDIENFFPSISSHRIRDIFEARLGCSEEVSQLLTRLCTYEHHLAQGLITSPILADFAVRRIDVRIAGLCAQHGLVYTRFVDDATISGPFSLDKQTSGITRLIHGIFKDCGFALASHKEQSGALESSDIAITGLRIVRGHLDAKLDYIRRLEDHIEAHRLLGIGGLFEGPLFTRDQLRGRTEYVCMINKNRSRALRQRFGLIAWDRVESTATERGLMVCRRVLRPVELLNSAK